MKVPARAWARAVALAAAFSLVMGVVGFSTPAARAADASPSASSSSTPSASSSSTSSPSTSSDSSGTGTNVQHFSQGGSYQTQADALPSSIYIAIPDGLTPTTVTGRLTFQNTGLQSIAGRVEVIADGLVVASVDKSLITQEATITIPVSSEDVSHGYLVFSLLYLSDGVTDVGKVCTDPHLGSVTLDKIKVSLIGHEVPPSTLASFFSPSVRTISVTVPQDADPSVKTAGLAAVAALSHIYGTDTQISLTSPADSKRAASPTAVGGRRVEIVPGQGDPRTSINLVDGVRTLTITGDPSHLKEAAAALGSKYLGLADATDTTSLQQTGVPTSALTRTFDQLGQSAPKLQGLGVSQFIVGASQSDFGRSVGEMTVHIIGVHAAIPDSLSGVLSYYWNDQLIGSQVLQTSTKIDQTLDVPSTQIGRSNALTVELVAIPTGNSDKSSGSSSGSVSPFDCGGAASVLPIEVDIDGKASTITAVPGEAFEPGFVRFPQTLSNSLTVVFGDGQGSADDSLTDAAQLLCSLQRLNTSEIDVSVASFDSFASTEVPGMVIDASSDQVDKLNAPLRMGAFRTLDANNVSFGAGVDAPFAALQAFQNNGRDVILLSSWGAHQPDRTVGSLLEAHLADTVASPENGWGSLSGNIDIAQSLTKLPILLDSAAIAPQAVVVHHISGYLKWVAIFAILFALLLGGQSWARRRQRRRAARMVDAEEQEDASPSSDNWVEWVARNNLTPDDPEGSERRDDSDPEPGARP